MSANVFDEVVEKINLLEPEEQQHVMSVLSEKASLQIPQKERPKKKWADVMGMLPYPAFGEDAQEYISRSRREAEEQRLKCH